jgi:hypothetical protein
MALSRVLVALALSPAQVLIPMSSVPAPASGFKNFSPERAWAAGGRANS